MKVKAAEYTISQRKKSSGCFLNIYCFVYSGKPELSIIAVVFKYSLIV